MAMIACPSCRKRISSEANSCPSCGDPLKPGWVETQRRNSVITTLSWVAGLVGLFAIAATNIGHEANSVAEAAHQPAIPEKPLTPAEKKALEAERAKKEAEAAPEKFLELTATSASKGGFDAVVILSGTVKNNSAIRVKDPKIECYLFSETRTALGSVSETIFKVIPPKASIHFEDANMGFADSRWQRYSCLVVSATPLVATK